MKKSYKRIRNFLFFFLFMALLVLLAGCGGVALDTDPDPDNSTIEIFLFTSSTAEIQAGEEVILDWSVGNTATHISIDGNGQIVGDNLELSGQISVFPVVTTTYTLTASNDADTQTLVVQVTVLDNDNDQGEEYGFLTIYANVAASIYLNDVDTGYSAPHNFTELSPGTYTVKLTREYYKNWETEVSVVAGEITTIEAELVLSVETVVLKASKDAWIQSIDVHYNGGAVDFLLAGALDTYYGIGLYKSYFYFDVSSIPSNAHIIDSSLYLYYFESMGEEDCNDINYSLSIVKVLSDWDEHTIRWKNQPADMGDWVWGGAKLPTSPTYDFVEIGVNSNMIEPWVQGTDDNYGFILCFPLPEMGDDCPLSRKFYSREYNETNKRPKLLVQYWIPE